MLVYSRTINLFIQRYTKEALLILKNEVGFEAKNKRFLFNGFYYPLSIVVFDDEKKWGYFESGFYKIALNKKLILEANHELVLNILRHELAHYLCFIKHGNDVQDHGEEFRGLCRKYNWGREVYLSTLNYSEVERKCHKSTERIREKIKKVMALQSSSNRHEAELATLKVNELLIKYNLDNAKVDEYEDSEEIYVRRVLQGKRKSAKYDSIGVILNEFFVKTVFSSGKNEFFLEVLGNKLNVETADYVAKFLFNEFENLYKNAKKENSFLKGRTAKNNFFYGLSEGFVSKMNDGKKNINSRDLILVNEKLERSIQVVYPRLRGSKRSMTYDPDALGVGKKVGQGLSIRPGISGNSRGLLLEGEFKDD